MLPIKLIPQKSEVPTVPPPAGGIGLGTWRTSAEFKDVKVTEGEKEIFASNFDAGLKGWHPNAGRWEVSDATLRQTDTSTQPRAIAGMSTGRTTPSA